MIHNSIKKFAFLSIVLLLAFSSCKNANRSQKPMVPPVTGKPGDITMVINDNYWESNLGDTLKWAFYQEFYGLPEVEPLYNLLHVPYEGFSKLFKSTRNILIFEIDQKYDTAVDLVQKDLWAKPQLVIKIAAPDKNSAMNLFLEKKDNIIAYFDNAERKRFTDIYAKSLDKGLMLKIKRKHKIELNIPNGYEVGMDSVNFTWLDNIQADNITQGFFIYEYPYSDTNTFSKEFLINKRNEILRRHVQGSTPGSYMTTEELLPPLFREFALKGKTYVAEIRGLWKVINDMMGGPFVSYTTYDKENNRVVTVEGYIFAPGHKKRILVKQLEAVLVTLKVDNIKSEEK